MQTIPIKIRPHLIPFFYQELKGEEARLQNKRVKACRISLTSSVGMIISMCINRNRAVSQVKNIDDYYLYLSISEKNYKKSEGSIYTTSSGERMLLELPEKVADNINCLLEDQFRVSLVSAVDWATKYNKHIDKKTVFEDFMVKYELDEFGFKLNSLRRMYDRESEKDALLSRMQTKASNRVLNYR